MRHENGKLPASELSPIPGGQLNHEAAVAWLAMRSFIGKSKGVWITPTSHRTSYRSFKDQQFFWNEFLAGRGALAARPGRSNHGWGKACDLRTPAMQAAVRECGHTFGWGIRGGKLGSDAPSEAWHATFHPGVFKAPAKPKHTHPYHLMSDRERAARDVLVKERRIAKRNGGWGKVDAGHAARAVDAKAKLRQYARDITAAAKESGWEKAHRKARLKYINQLIGA